MSHWFLGTIGFSYKDWVGSFYPVGTAQHGYLTYYSKVFNSVVFNYIDILICNLLPKVPDVI